MIVFDSGALIALLRLEPGALITRQLLRANAGSCYIHAINLCEIYYGFERAQNQAFAERVLSLLEAAGINVREDMTIDFWKEAAHLKAVHRLSVADAFAVTLARQLNAPLVTTDHHELDAIAAAGICKITFIR